MSGDVVSSKKHWAERTAIWAGRHWHKFSSVGGTLLIAVASAPNIFVAGSTYLSQFSIYPGPWGWQQWVFTTGAVLVVVGLLREVLLRPSYSELISERDRALSNAEASAREADATLRTILIALAESMGLRSKTNRASIYWHVGTEFALLERFSENATFAKNGRNRYPGDQGVLGKAWNESVATLGDLPSNKRDWVRRLAELSFSTEVAQALGMQSRSIVGRRIEVPMSGGPRWMGVLVFESTAARGVKAGTIDDLNSNAVWKLLPEVMANAVDHFTERAEKVISVARPVAAPA